VTVPRALRLTAAALLAAAASVALAQDYGETVEVDVVTVDVEVRDAQGRQVTDLERGDFQVFEDGKHVRLTNFERVVARDAGPAAATAPTPAPAAPPPDGPASGEAVPADTTSWVVVYVDNLRLHNVSRTRALDQMRHRLAEAVPGERVMVVSQDISFNVRLPFSADRAAVDAALAALETVPTYGASADRDRSTAMLTTIAMQKDAMAVGEPCNEQVAAPAKSFAEGARADVLRTVSRLLAFTNSLAGLPGRKALLYVSDGIPLQPGEEMFQALAEMCGGGAGISGAALPDNLPAFDSQTLGSRAYPAHAAALDAARYSVANDLRRLTAHANANRVSFYALQASGLAAPADSSVAMDPTDRLFQLPSVSAAMENNAKESLVYLANETGGRAIIDTNDFTGELDRLRADLATYYSLGYVPDHQGDAKEHRIEVRVARKGLRLDYRRSYRDKPALEQLADRTLAALTHGYEDNPLEVKLEMLPAEPLPNGHFRVTARLLVPLFKLATLTREDVYEAKLRVVVAAGGSGGESTGLRQVEVPVRVPRQEALTAFGQSYAYEVRLELGGGEHTLAFAVRDELAGTASFLRRKVDIEAPVAAAIPKPGDSEHR
jgi:VWFA-related protein